MDPTLESIDIERLLPLEWLTPAGVGRRGVSDAARTAERERSSRRRRATPSRSSTSTTSGSASRPRASRARSGARYPEPRTSRGQRKASTSPWPAGCCSERSTRARKCRASWTDRVRLSRGWQRHGIEEQRLYEMTRLKDQFAELLKTAGLLQADTLIQAKNRVARSNPDRCCPP
eukprot:60837-Rhodomonas_salina.2